MSSPENTKPQDSVPVFDVMNRMAETISAVAHYARHDQLTGMLNKDAWKHEIEERLKSEEPFGVLLMDMDGFKRVNDSFGHERGDSLLEQFGLHMRKHFRRSGDQLTHEQFIKNDHDEADLGRTGGDEFGMLFEVATGNDRRVTTEQESMGRTIDYAQSVINEFVAAQPEDIRALGFGVSLGSAMRERGEQVEAGTLLHTADMRMYDNKHSRDAAR